MAEQTREREDRPQPISAMAPDRSYPIQLSLQQEQAVKNWAADDRLWTTQETVEFNLRVFARTILSLSGEVDQ